MTMQAKNLDIPDEKHSFEHGDVRLVTLPGVTIGRAEFNPGWRWSTDVAPAAGTASCQGLHLAYVVSGRLHVRMDSGEEMECGAGDAHVVGPGHDAWVVGEEPCITIDFIPAPTGARVAQCPCGVEFRVASEAGLDHLVAAVQEHAGASHGHEVTREQILEEVMTA
jgi:hypothetical protein